MKSGRTGSAQATFVIIKPDAIQKSLTGNIFARLSETRLKIIGAQARRVGRDLAVKHYEHLKDKKFFDEVIDFIMGKFHADRVMTLVYYGPRAIEKVRKICGATNPEEADPDTIRGSYGRITTKGVFENVIHASADERDAEREIKLWYRPDELTVPDLYPTKTVQTTEKTRIWA